MGRTQTTIEMLPKRTNTTAIERRGSILIYVGMVAGLQIYLVALAITYQIMLDDPTTLVVNIDEVQHYVTHNDIKIIELKDIKEFAETRISITNRQNQIDIVYGATILVYCVLAYTITYCLS